MRPMANKSLSRSETYDLVRAVVKVSLFVAGVRILFVVFDSGWTVTLSRWPVELGFLFLILAFTSLTVFGSVLISRHVKKKDTES